MAEVEARARVRMVDKHEEATLDTLRVDEVPFSTFDPQVSSLLSHHDSSQAQSDFGISEGRPNPKHDLLLIPSERLETSVRKLMRLSKIMWLVLVLVLQRSVYQDLVKYFCDVDQCSEEVIKKLGRRAKKTAFKETNRLINNSHERDQLIYQLILAVLNKNRELAEEIHRQISHFQVVSCISHANLLLYSLSKDENMLRKTELLIQNDPADLEKLDFLAFAVGTWSKSADHEVKLLPHVPENTLDEALVRVRLAISSYFLGNYVQCRAECSKLQKYMRKYGGGTTLQVVVQELRQILP